MSPARTLQLAVRFSLREMRGGLSGFMIFLTCIALGVAAIGGVNSVARSITAGVANEGQVLLGGDIRFELNQRQASAEEKTFLDGLGTVAESASMRSMVRLEDGSDQTLAEVKAVDGLYPLFGALVTEPALPRDELFGERNGIFGAAAPDLMFERLGIELGAHVRLGTATFELRARLVTEPDAASEGFGFAPRLLVSLEGLTASGLVQPGSLVEYAYKARLPGNPSEAALAAVRDQAAEQFPQAGWSIRTRLNAAPSLSANIERFSQFLTLVGLTALVVGGVGVGNAVRAYLEGKRGVIATFKSLGASGGFVVSVYLVQILIIAGIGIVIGLVLGAIMPFAATAALSSVIPVPVEGGLYPDALGMAALFGLLVTLLFALLPLGRARDIPATALFRELGVQSGRLPRRVYMLAVAVLALLLAGLAIWFSGDRRIAAIFVGGVVFSFLVLRLVGQLVQMLARKSPRVRFVALRLAIGNIHRPGALTPSVVLSLGLGLTLLVTLALIDGNLRQQISGSLPERAPNFFFVDIQSTEVENFADFIAREAPAGKLVRVPMLRGRIVELNGIDLQKIEIPAEGGWVLRGDRGLTYEAQQPDNATLSAGTWWPQDYAGEPLVSFSAEEAGELGLKLGDTITVNVLGRNLTARIANFRQVKWESMGINFVMVFSPNTFAGAPHSWLATLSAPDASVADEARLLNAVTRAFPAVTTVRVKDALDVVNRIVAQLGTAIRAAASVALIASVLVLSGALAAGNRARVHDAVVLKTLGATRRTLISAFSLEYALIGLATAIFALFAGGTAAWFVVARIMNLPSSFMPEVAVATVVAALVLTVGFGLLGTWRVLGHKAAPVLRNL
ncbi:MAG: ABC transporter permease [Alphaproteobacteria bacterium]|nr:ABC transporter permease [Alphaproteobacteria bacterium]MBU0805650.1 ABC transporter permease [Alphaproteobacteria bacterium]MBU0873596.1 ABC transporter permease [Alphaproteobacteria bacterium]MBU1401176.1 ABC transporter permease [Alphaproteobacteria bacterium]MBU1592407.1 ABC transporter permease [Alphaproteobacteria bacterium]